VARGKRPSVSPYERRRWLEELEKGKGITEISRAAGRDIRVVKRHIEVALEESQIAQTRRDFLLGRLEQHQEDLLAEVQRLRQLVSQYPPRPLEPTDSMQQKVHEALKEHARRLLLWGLLEVYHHAVREYQEARDGVSRQLAEKEAKQILGLPQEVATYPWTPRLVETLEQGISLKGPSGRSYAENKESGGIFRPSWGELSLTRSTITEASLPAVLEAHKKLLSYAERYLPMFQEQRRRLGELADQITRELDVFRLKRLVPGRCKYCPL